MSTRGSGSSPPVKTAFHIEDDGRGLVFLSEREKGLDDGLKELFPNAAHSFCVYHVEKNVKVRYKTTVEGLLFTAAKTWCPKPILKQYFFVRGSDVTIRPILAAFGRSCDVAFHPRFHSACFPQFVFENEKQITRIVRFI